MKIKRAVAHFELVCDFLVQCARRFRVGLFCCGSGRTERANSRRKSRVLICFARRVLLLGSDGDSVTCHPVMTCPEVSWPGRASKRLIPALPRPSGLALKWKLSPNPLSKFTPSSSFDVQVIRFLVYTL